MGTVHNLCVKSVEQLPNFESIFVLRQAVREIAEAIQIDCWLAQHLEVRVFADKFMKMTYESDVLSDSPFHAQHDEASVMS